MARRSPRVCQVEAAHRPADAAGAVEAAERGEARRCRIARLACYWVPARNWSAQDRLAGVAVLGVRRRSPAEPATTSGLSEVFQHRRSADVRTECAKAHVRDFDSRVCVCDSIFQH